MQSEKQLNRYKVQAVQFTNGEWRTHGPWMRLIVTDRRLVVFPDHAPQQAKHLVIYPQMIARAWSVCLGKRDGTVIALKSGQLLYFYVHWSESVKLVRDIQALLKPPHHYPMVATTTNKRITN